MPAKGKVKASKKAVVQPVKEPALAPATNQSAEVQPEDDVTLASCKVATECNALVKTFVQGARYEGHREAHVGFEVKRLSSNQPPGDCRPKAKKALQKLAKDYPRSPLPHRYLVRWCL